MAVRSIFTAGAAFATAGMVALVPAIAPPLAPRDIQVIKQTEAQVNLTAALTLPDLINVFFGVTPQGAYPTNPPTPGDILLPPVTDAAGSAGISGVIYQLLAQQQGAYLPGRAGLDAFVNGGLSQYVQLMLLSQNTDPSQQAGINAFFAGISELVRLYLVTNNSSPDQVAGINAFFDGGASQLAYEYLASGTTDPQSLEYLDIFFGQNDEPVTGATGVVYKRLRDGFTDPVQQANIDAFFTGGVTSVAQLQLLAGFQDPQQQQVINDFFSGGITQVSRTQILSRLSDPNQINLVNEFYDNGISGVVRYLLVGPEPVDPTPPPPDDRMPLVADEDAGASLLKVAAVDEGVDEGEAKDDPAVTPVAKVDPAPADPAPADPAPAPAAPAAAAAPAPAADPAPAPAEPKPAFTAKVRDQSVAEEKAAEAEDPGTNKAEPEIIIGGGPNPGSGSWGVFGQIAQGVHDAIAGLSAPKPADPGPSAGADAGGDAGGGGEGGGEG